MFDQLMWHESQGEYVQRTHRVIIFTKNTMKILHFLKGNSAGTWPLSHFDVDLYRRCDHD